MGNVNSSSLRIAVQLLQLRAHLKPQTGIEIGKGFIHKEDARPVDQHPGNSHPLLLPPGKLLGVSFRIAVESYIFEDLINLHGDFCFWQLFDLQPESDVVKNCHMRPERVGLEDQTQVSFCRRNNYFISPGEDTGFIKPYTTVRRFFQPGD